MNVWSTKINKKITGTNIPPLKAIIKEILSWWVITKIQNALYENTSKWNRQVGFLCLSWGRMDVLNAPNDERINRLYRCRTAIDLVMHEEASNSWVTWFLEIWLQFIPSSETSQKVKKSNTWPNILNISIPNIRFRSDINTAFQSIGASGCTETSVQVR